MDWEIGKRVLYKPYWGDYVSEGLILENSPNGEYVRIRTPNGFEEWIKKNGYKIVDILIDPSSQLQG